MKITKVLTIAAAMTAAAMMMSCAGLSANEDGDGAARTTYSVSSASALQSAISSASAGDTITLTSNISLSSTLQILTSGTSSSYITLNGNGKTIDCSGISSGWGVKVNGSYWIIKNVTVQNAPDCGLVFQLGGYNKVQYCKFLSNGDSGLQVYNSAHDVTVTKCESYYNYDSANGGENADGFAAKLSGGKNIKFNYCIAKYNSDDGWDLYSQPYTVTLNNCEAAYNGYISSSLTTTTNGDGNGFKLGSAYANVSHRLISDVAHHNLACGFDGNGNTATMSISGCSSYSNKKYQWYRITGVSNQ
jgi:hypothetical protein